jgi:hypothetical protein
MTIADSGQMVKEKRTFGVRDGIGWLGQAALNVAADSPTL